MRALLKKLIPKPFIGFYHYSLARIAAIWYRHPSKKLIVIGVTGTNGKSSTVQLLAQILTHLDHKVGYTTTAGFNIGGKEIENKLKMTMPGRFLLQNLMSQMVGAKCTYAIIETTSLGIEQYRHLGIQYDTIVFTNLTPEHIEAHGGFDAYRKAKGKLFAHTSRLARKKRDGKTVQKISVINQDDEAGDYFGSFPLDEVLRYSWDGDAESDIIATKKKSSEKGVSFTLGKIKMSIPLFAEFEQKNTFAAIATCKALDLDLKKVAKVLKELQPIPGRFEIIDAGQPFKVVVDYAYEPYALKALFQSAKKLHPKRIIGIHGACGGGRDVAKRPTIGKLAANEEDIVIVTNEDPYEENPRKIIEEVAAGAKKAGMKEGKNLYLINDRTEAINFAISLARKDDMVLITGKGSEPVMAVAGGKKVPWSDRRAALNALQAL